MRALRAIEVHARVVTQHIGAPVRTRPPSPAIVSLVNVVFGPAWEFGLQFDTQLIGLAPFDVDLGDVVPVTGDDVLLASLTFSGDAKGSTALEALFDPDLFQGFALVDIGAFAEVSQTPGNIQVVPEPATLALLLPGLLGVGMLGRRRVAAK